MSVTNPITTCQICGRAIKAGSTGRIVRHGYSKTNGQHRNNYCDGSGYPPFEVSTKALEFRLITQELRLKNEKLTDIDHLLLQRDIINIQNRLARWVAPEKG